MTFSLMAWQIRRALDKMQSPSFCKVYAKRTPSLPWHNGTARCIGCGKVTR